MSIVSDNNIKPVRAMHLVSSEGVTGAVQQTLFMPMLTRMPKPRVRTLVVALAPNVVPGPVLRQNGVPVYDVALSRRKFSLAAFRQLSKAARSFRPDVIQAWGHTAQIVSHWLRNRCDWDVKLVWTVANTTPLPRNPGFIDRHKLKYAAKRAKRADRIVYTSEAAAATYRRCGFPEQDHLVIPPGLDPTRFKPDMAVRRKVREQLGIGHDAFVIGMIAPFQPEYDHATLLKAVGEIIKTNPNISLLLAGHGAQKGNAPLMALVGGGTLGTRTHLLGEWSDVASFFNACDLACSSALNDNARMSLVTAMLCGVPCVATGMGAQGEVIGHFGVAVEPGSPTAFIRGISRIMQMPPEKRLAMAQGARKHALANFVSIRSLQRYLQLYYDLTGRTLTAAASVPAPKVDASIPAPASAEKQTPKPATKPKATVDMHELCDPDSLESRDPPAIQAPAAAAPVRPAPKPNEADVLEMFETSLAKQPAPSPVASTERARGIVEEQEDLLAPEMLQAGAAATANPPQTAAPRVDVVKPAAAPKAELDLTLTRTSQPTKIIAAASASTDAGDDLSSAETTLDLAAKLKFEATSTLEIPADLIFLAADAAKPASTSAASSTPRSQVEAKPQRESKPVPPASSPGEAPTSSPVTDSSTVPALVVDALLSAAESSVAHPGRTTPVAQDALQLDLLGDDSPTDRKKVAR